MQCGEDVYATLANGTLTISGTGDMWEKTRDVQVGMVTQRYYDSIFGDYKAYIREVIVDDGVTSIAGGAFYGFSELTMVTLSDTVETIGQEAFRETGIRRFVCPENLKSIGKRAFYKCSALVSVSFNDKLEDIGWTAFYDSGLQEAVLPEGCMYRGYYDYDYDTVYTLYLGNGQYKGISYKKASFNKTTVHKKTQVTLNADGGTVNGASTATIVQYEGEAYGKPSKLPTPVRDGYDFLGWYDWIDGIEGNNVAGSTETVKYHAELRAKWCDHSSTVLKNAKSASYTSDGYTGDTYCNNASCGKRLELGKTIAKKTLAAPKMSSVGNVKNGLKIKWTKSKDAKGYYVYRKIDGVYTRIATVTSGTSYVDESVKSSTGKRYTYKVCAYYSTATSKFTGTKSEVRVASSYVSSLKSTSKKTMTVNWKKVSGSTGYQVQYSTDKNFKNKVTTKTIKNSSDTYRKITKLSSGKKQYVRVRSYKVVNGKKYYSAWSSVKSVKVK